MKKYLFDVIYVDSNGKVTFKSFRKISFVECFTTCKCGAAKVNSYSHDQWLYYPKTFKEFLNCLALTKTYGEKYTINAKLADEEHSFENLLKAFARYVYEEKNATKKELVDFYKKANEIKKATDSERALLEKNIKDLLR